MTEYVFELKDKRKLGYAFYGPGDGAPVLYFHGTPSSRLEPLLLKSYNKDIERLLHENKINLIAVDRPGMGHSSYNPKGTLYSCAHDINELMEHLQISKSKVLCWSGGGSYALSLAYHFPQLVQQVFIIAGCTRSLSEHGVFENMNGNVYYFWSAKNIPLIMRAVMNFVGKKEANKPLPKWLSGLPPVDHDLLNHPATINHFTKVTLNEACRHGSRGLVHEAAIYFNETGYKLSEIVQPVHYWWGTDDNTMTRVHPEAIEKQTPKAVMHYKQGEGHLSVYINCIEEVLQTIAKS